MVLNHRFTPTETREKSKSENVVPSFYFLIPGLKSRFMNRKESALSSVSHVKISLRSSLDVNPHWLPLPKFWTHLIARCHSLAQDKDLSLTV